MLTEGSKSKKDFYIDENGFFVFTREFHLRRGFCCKNNCRHCPYGKVEKGESHFATSYAKASKAKKASRGKEEKVAK